MMSRILFHLASRVLNTPLMVTQGKLSAILAVIGPRIGLDVSSVDQVAIADFSVPKRYREESGDGIGLIPIYDTLVFRNQGLNVWSGLTTYEEIREQFLEALRDPTISAILLDIDSPGGEVSGVFDLVDDIYDARGTKPIYAIANESALSAAYAIASAADRIFVPRTGAVGSVGVRLVHVDQSAFDEKTGFKYTTIFAGDRKNDFTPHEPLSEDATGIARGMVEETYSLFVRTVARNRGIAESVIRDTKAGIYQGDAAVGAGLADEVRNFSEVVQYILDSKGAQDMKLFGRSGNSKQAVETESVDQNKETQPESLLPDEDEEREKREQVEEEARSEGYRTGFEAALKQTSEILNLCAAADKEFPLAMAASLILSGVSVEEARSKIMEVVADRSGAVEITSTVRPLSTGQPSPLTADAERRAEEYRKRASASH